VLQRAYVFPDLIRHGKNHHQSTKQQQHQTSQDPQPSQNQQSAPASQSHKRQEASTPQTKELAAKIVEEERQARVKMPTYKGLERFKLLDKMGE